ncbi:MAG: hypothetical protein ABFS14_11760 [Gemmatimonadota bacterium]
MNEPDNATGLDRFLRLFSDVRSGEGTSALILALNVFLILTAYYLIKPVREALILSGGGAEVKSYAAAGQALLLAGAVPLYGWLAGKLPRKRLINIVTFFFVACLGVFFLLAQTSLPLGVPFYLWVGVFNLMIVAQFWSFANDLYTSDEGERLFPVVAFGASAGAVFGSYVAGRVIEVIGINPLLLLAAALLLIGLTLTNYVDLRERRRTEAGVPEQQTTALQPAATGEIRLETGELTQLRDAFLARLAEVEAEEGSGAGDEGEDLLRVRSGKAAGFAAKPESDLRSGPPQEGGSAFGLVFRYRYLLLIAIMMLLLNWVNTTGEYILGSVIEDAATGAVAAGTAEGLGVGEYIGRFYSDFFLVVNALGLFLQLFVVSRVLKYLGVRAALVILPILVLGAYALLAFYPVLAFVRWAKTAENATDYSLQNTVRNVLFLPTTREQKYKAKQAIDSFFVRAGDVLSAGVVFAGTTWLAMSTMHFALFNMVLGGVWLTVVLAIGVRYRKLVASGLPPS